MRPDQIDKLKEIRAKLFDVVMLETDPANWSGKGKAPKDMTKEERGDDVWCRKQAAASLLLLVQVDRLARGDVDHQPEDDLDEDERIAQAEQEAEKLLERVGLPGRSLPAKAARS